MNTAKPTLLTRRAALGGAVGALIPAWAHADRAPVRVALQPYGRKIGDRDIAAVQDAITAFFEVEVAVLPRRPHPKKAWYAPRKRWRADVLLDDLVTLLPSGTVQILGLTTSDISVTKGEHNDWGVLGYGMIGGPACVVSRFRCRFGSRGRTHTRQRLAKVCLHELGHTLGSDHCPTDGCLMHDAEGLVKPLDSEFTFCEDTMQLFKARGAPLRDNVILPWPSEP